MRLECIKYEWLNSTEDININFFSDVTPQEVGNIDLYDYFIEGTMGSVEYTFEDITSENTLAVEASSLTFNCIDDNYGNINLIDFFECFISNRYLKWKLNYYDDDNELIYSGILYKDGINISTVEDKILSFTVLGYEKEFKEYYNNIQLGSSFAFPYNYGNPSNPIMISPGGGGFTYLRFYSARTFFKLIFPNVDFQYDLQLIHMLNGCYVSEMPYTFANNYQFKDLGSCLHIKTGYDAYQRDGITRMTFFESMLLGMGWIWYFHLGKMVIQERANLDYDTLELNYNEVQITQSLSHNFNQFQVDNIVIEDGEYYDSGQNYSSTTSCFCIFDNGRPVNASSHNLGGYGSMAYSTITSYLNMVRPFRNIFHLLNDTSNVYLMEFHSGHDFTRRVNSDNFNYILEKTSMSGTGNSLDFTTEKYNYLENKTLILRPYVNTRDNSGGFDRNLPRASSGIYWSNGNFYAGGNTITNSMGVYNGSPANALIRYDTDISKYINYESYARSERFQNNFKKFLKTNDEVIFEIEVAQVITNPLQTVRITNYPYANINDKTFSIIKLSFNEREKTSRLTLQMIQTETQGRTAITYDAGYYDDYFDFVIDGGNPTSEFVYTIDGGEI